MAHFGRFATGDIELLLVTKAARARLLSKLNRRNAGEGIAFRFLRMDNGWKLRPDRAHPDDTSFSHEGRDVLVLDSSVAAAMGGMTLDVRQTVKGAKLDLLRTNLRNA